MVSLSLPVPGGLRGRTGEDEAHAHLPPYPYIYLRHLKVWADHADVISKAYSGTGALKTDFTRTGKRSKEGALQDGVNSLTRYLKNNFFDGARQDAYDLFTGAWNPRAGDLRIDERALLVRSMPWILLFSAIMIFAAIFLPRDSSEQHPDQTAWLCPCSSC